MVAERSGRQAVVIGVAEFGEDPGPEEEPGLPIHPPLPYVPKLAPQVRDVLAEFGYGSELVLSKTKTTAQKLGRRVRGQGRKTRLDPVGIRLVYVLSHGERPIGGTDGLVIIGSDGKWCQDTDVAFWLAEVTNNEQTHPTTLFLLDVCHGGVAARLPWQLLTADGASRAWVIAACEQDRSAFDGRFTRALVDVLTGIVNGSIDINPTVEFVPLSTVAQRVRRRVLELSQGKSSQQVTSSVLDIGADDPRWPFFPNPSFRSGTLTLGGGKDASLAEFATDLDPAVDPWHFSSRAAGVNAQRGLPRTGHFRGRASQLEALTSWFDDPNDADPIRVVTGAPGAGKSALLGVMVCAAHPRLREPTQQLWSHLKDVPSANPDLVAVHARQRSLASIVTSIVQQLGIEDLDDAEPAATPWRPTVVLDAVITRPQPPVLVIDALDEAIAPTDVVRELILPLLAARRPDGRPAARLLVGTRTGSQWPQFDPLLSAVTDHQLIDLSSTPPAVLQNDLTSYLDDLLRTRPPYDRVGMVEIRQMIAAGVAGRLVTGDTAQWGEFLVAGLYAHHLLSRPEPPATRIAVHDLLTDIPTTLPAVLELDLASRDAGDDLTRALLTALAYAKGEGLPLTLLAALIAGQVSSGDLTTDQVINALAENRFYLRYSTDTDGTTLYRLFHQGLTDYLKAAAS